jgi:hypothetical protein
MVIRRKHIRRQVFHIYKLKHSEKLLKAITQSEKCVFKRLTDCSKFKLEDGKILFQVSAERESWEPVSTRRYVIIDVSEDYVGGRDTHIQFLTEKKLPDWIKKNHCYHVAEHPNGCLVYETDVNSYDLQVFHYRFKSDDIATIGACRDELARISAQETAKRERSQRAFKELVRFFKMNYSDSNGCPKICLWTPVDINGEVISIPFDEWYGLVFIYDADVGAYFSVRWNDVLIKGESSKLSDLKVLSLDEVKENYDIIYEAP